MSYRIFVVDDSTMYSKFLKGLLESELEGCEIQCYHNPEDTWKAFEANKPHLVILDYNMPEMNGDDWMVKLSETCLISELMVVMVTGNNLDDNFVFGMHSLGVEEVFEKPVQKDSFISTIKELLEEVAA